MSSDLLTDAVGFKKKKMWQKAVEYYEMYLEDYNNNVSDKVFASYIKCLRLNGETQKALKLINQKANVVNDSEVLLNELFKIQDDLGKWKDNRKIAEKLIEINPTKSNYYFYLGRSLAYLKEDKEAEQTYKSGLEHRHNLSFPDINHKVLAGITEEYDKVNTEFKFLGGRNNYGVLLHDFPNHKYFTKISKNSRGPKREKLFYTNIYTKFPELHGLAPEFINSKTFDKIQYLTIERIENIKGKKDLESVIKLSEKISSVNYEELIKHCANPNYSFTVRSRGSTVVNFFTKIHEEAYNKRMISEFKSFGSQNNYPQEALEIIDKIQALIVNNHLYAFIVPELHYSLLHGDIIPSNMMINKENGNLQIFDWTNFTIGPRFLDIARFVTVASISYEEVKDKYLFNNNNGLLSLIEKIFFLYAYNLLFYITLKNKGMNTQKIIHECMFPALKDMSDLIDQFKKQGYEDIKNIIIYKDQLIQVEKEDLEKKVGILSQRNNQLNEKYQNVIKSKSWRITYPIRKIFQYLRKK